MPDSMSSSPLVACLDPRVDEQVVHDQMQSPPSEPNAESEPQSEAAPEEPESGREQSINEARP